MSEQFYDDNNKENKNNEYHFTGEQLNQVSQDAASQNTASENGTGQSSTAQNSAGYITEQSGKGHRVSEQHILRNIPECRRTEPGQPE